LGGRILPSASAGVHDDPERLVEERTRRLEALGVVTVAQMVDAHLAVGRRRMDEAGPAEIDADMRIGPVAGIEKHQIARAQC